MARAARSMTFTGAGDAPSLFPRVSDRRERHPMCHKPVRLKARYFLVVTIFVTRPTLVSPAYKLPWLSMVQ